MVKAYKKKLKKHGDSVLAIHSPKGVEGGDIISGSSDHLIRVWRFSKKKSFSTLDVPKPNEQELYHYKEAAGELLNYAGEHILNTVSCI